MNCLIMIVVILFLAAFTNYVSCSTGLTDVAPRAVEGVINCGKAMVVETLVDGCNSVPCHLVFDNAYRVEMDFRPKYNQDDLLLSVRLITNGTTHQLVNTKIPDTELQAGQLYTFGYTINVLLEYLGDGRLTYSLFGIDENGQDMQELCVWIGVSIDQN